jgi:Transcription factor WhiB
VWGLNDPGDLDELLALLDPPAWHADAVCKEHTELSWIPGRGDVPVAPKAVWGGCLVAAECRAWALAQGPDLYGVWAV